MIPVSEWMMEYQSIAMLQCRDKHTKKITKNLLSYYSSSEETILQNYFWNCNRNLILKIIPKDIY